MTAPRVLPADVYDTLELSALAYGGIGGRDWTDRHDRPLCVMGHAIEAAPDFRSEYTPFYKALVRANIHLATNDAAVPSRRRVSFREWCRRLNVVRGSQ